MRHVYIYSILLTVFLTTTLPVHAELMQGSGYKLETNLFNTFTKEKIKVNTSGSNSENETDVTTQNNSEGNRPTQTQETPYTLSLLINPTEIEFGTLTAGEPIQRSLALTTTATQGFQLQIAEKATLSSGESTIPDTSCDEGQCTPQAGANWENPLVFGFGYSCSSNIDCIGFPNSQSFKPLANLNEGMSPQPLITSFDPIITETDLTFKVNISPSNAGKEYSGTVVLYTLPNY